MISITYSRTRADYVTESDLSSQLRDTTTDTYWVKNQERNEALDLTVYAHAALWILQNKIDPKTYRDLSTLHAEIVRGRGEPERAMLHPRVISTGI